MTNENLIELLYKQNIVTLIGERLLDYGRLYDMAMRCDIVGCISKGPYSLSLLSALYEIVHNPLTATTT